MSSEGFEDIDRLIDATNAMPLKIVASPQIRDIDVTISAYDAASAGFDRLARLAIDAITSAFGVSSQQIGVVKEGVDSYSQQRNTMAPPIKCSNPGCELCYPKPSSYTPWFQSPSVDVKFTIDPAKDVSPLMRYERMPDGSIKLIYDYPSIAPGFAPSYYEARKSWPTVAGPLTFADPTGSKYFKKEESSMSSSPAQNIINGLNAVASDSSVDLSGVKRTIDSIEAERKRCIEKDLQGLINLEIRKGTKAKRFVLVYFAGNEAHTVYGTAYPGHDVEGDEAEKKIEGYTVHLHAHNDSYVYHQHKTMRSLCKRLEDNKSPYRIAYFDNEE